MTWALKAYTTALYSTSCSFNGIRIRHTPYSLLSFCVKILKQLYNVNAYDKDGI